MDMVPADLGDVVRFRRLLRSRVNTYFAGRRPGADPGAWVKLALGLAVHGGTLALLCLPGVAPLIFLTLWIANGLAQAFLLVNVAHDAVHTAFTRRRRIDAWLAHVMSLCGMDPNVFRRSHNDDHHGVMNVGAVDNALDTRGLIRVSPLQPRSKLGRWQSRLAWAVYAMGFLDLAFIRDFQLARRYNQPLARLAVNKLLYLAVLLGLPLLLSGKPAALVLGGFIAGQMAAGVAMLLLFQITHLVEGNSFPAALPEDHVSHVLATTTDVAPDSRLLAAIGGGLHTHVAHHLFPGICHVHYPALTRLITATARECGLPYRVNQRFGTAVAAHHRLLHRLV